MIQHDAEFFEKMSSAGFDLKRLGAERRGDYLVMFYLVETPDDISERVFAVRADAVIRRGVIEMPQGIDDIPVTFVQIQDRNPAAETC